MRTYTYVYRMVDTIVSDYNSITGAVREKCQRRKMNGSKRTTSVKPCFLGSVMTYVLSTTALFFEM